MQKWLLHEYANYKDNASFRDERWDEGLNMVFKLKFRYFYKIKVGKSYKSDKSYKFYNGADMPRHVPTGWVVFVEVRSLGGRGDARLCSGG